MKQFILLCFTAVLAYAGNSLYSLQHNGVDTKHADGKTYHIEREISPKCYDVPIIPEAIWEGDFAGKDVPSACKATYVQTVGVIYPLHIKEGVETFAELEVLRFIDEMQKRDDYLLVDSRGGEWFESETIPGATNLWFAVLKDQKVFAEEFTEMLQQVGVKTGKDGKYDFRDAKTLLLFCNGPWCGQSPVAILEFIKIGYPIEKLKWYRSGLHGWKSLSLTTTRKQ
ncbi:MAG: rhodanese-like domain-containing protein [Campylobacterota bacterium]